MSHLREISKIIDKHRAEVVITCAEDCWCWGVEAAICGHAEHGESSKAQEEEK